MKILLCLNLFLEIKNFIKELKDGIYIEVDNKQVFVQFRQIIKAVQALPW